jgi:DNA-binding transcriptional MerR regulator
MSEEIRLYDERKTAEMLGLSVRCLQRWRQVGLGPPWVKLSSAVRYSHADLVAYLEKHLRGSADGSPREGDTT